MSATVSIQDDAFELFAGDTPIGPRRALDMEATEWLKDLIARYGPLERRADPAAAVGIGRDFYRWLDGDQRQLTRLLERAPRPLILTIHCPRRKPSPGEWALLQAPWEVLADDTGHLAADALLQYSPQRRLGPLGEPTSPDEYRLGLAFMAAAPQGVSELDYEAEEAAILDAVGDTELDLLVDESGEAAALGRRLGEIRETGGLQVLHLSCHGDNAWRDAPDQDPRPVLLLEDEAGARRPTDAAELLGALRPALPRLLFLSACRSAATAGHGPDPEAAQAPVYSLTGDLIRAGLPALIGWDGTVADAAAIRFAAALYRGLARREALALAVAEARRKLLADKEERIRNNWHLARLWLGSGADGAGPLVTGRRKRSLLPAGHIPPTFLGKEVPVASHAMFVGQRRELQRALRVLDQGRYAGLILTGMGRLGKSSLAARIANRRRDDWALAVLHGRFGPQDLLDRLAETLRDFPTARDRLRDGQTKVRTAAQQGEEEALVVLGDLLTDLLNGPCSQRDKDRRALLLVLDDFEQLLDEAAGARPVAASHAGLVATILRAFDPTATESRLLITSRFPFRLQEGGRDLAERLARIELTSFGKTTERKLVLRQQTAAQGKKSLTDLAEREDLLGRARAAARGNPGLLDLLIARLLLKPKVPLTKAAAALGEMEDYLAGGGLPEAEQLREILENIALTTLLDLAGGAGKDLLRAMTLFRLPVPRKIAEAFTVEIGGQVQDLIDLGLLEPGQDPVQPGLAAVRVSPLAAGRLSSLTAAERGRLAAVAVGPLFAAWGGTEERRPAVADLQLAELALAGEEAPIAAACGAGAVRALEADSYHKAAGLGKALIDLLGRAIYPVPWRLYADTARVIGADGDGKTADDLLERGFAAFEAAEETTDPDALPLLDGYADRLHQRGQLDEALRIRTQEQLPVYERLGDVHSKAVTQGKIADILTQRGALEEALHIRTEEELPVYERLGDVRSKAVTQGKITYILKQRGELDEALCLLTDEVLGAFERLGDVRSKAVTQGKIADILQARGELEEALRIRTEKELPVYERLGDVRSKAVTQGKITYILKQRGELDEALCILTDEVLGAFERLGDVRSKAVTQGNIADILTQRGQLEEALRIRTQEELPVYERLDDVHFKTVTQGQIADILTQRGELEEALRIRTQEELPVYERLGDVRSKAVTQGKIADILTQRGELEEALRIRIQEELPVYERLGDVREKALTQGKIADILTQRGEFEEALRIRTQEELPVYERLGDVHFKTVTQGQIADILTQRGELEEALRILTDEVLGAFERLGDVRSKAVTQGQITGILTQRGELEEALRILTDEVLGAFERLGDVREKALTQGKIADILTQRGQLEEALRILTDEVLGAFERLGDVREKALTQGKIADILTQRGQLEEALRIRTEEELPVYERLGDVRSKALTQGKIADILTQRGELEEALRIRTEEELPVYERLGDVRSKAVTQGKIADILTQRGQLEEALRIRTEEELPVYERLGDVREILVCRAKTALGLLARGRAEERAQANELLCLALIDAKRLRIPEAQWIEEILRQVGMDCR